MTHINSMIDWFVPYHYLRQADIYWKVKILVTSIFFLLVFNTFVAIFAPLVLGENNFPSLLVNALGLGVLLLLHFEYNYKICGNLFMTIVFLTLVRMSLTTGGLSSMDLNWLIFIPIFALLLTDKISSIIWAIIIVSYVIILYFNEKFQLFNIVTNPNFSLEYQCLQHVFLFVVILGTVFIFEKGKSDNIQQLKSQKELLNQQTEELQIQSNLIKTKNLDLNKLTNQLQSVNEELQQYAHVVSHDLKQPLRSITEYIKIFNKSIPEDLKKEQEENIMFINKGANQMEYLINSLLKHSTVTNSSKKIEAINLEDQLILITHSLRTQIEENKANINWKNLPNQINGIKVQIHQLFLNIISNAIKFRRPDKECEIKIDSKEMGDYWIFTISDNGIGMTDEDCKRIFQPFCKLHPNEKYQGSGIGLATCKKVVEQHKGEIWATSKLGEGTQFHFNINKKLAA